MKIACVGAGYFADFHVDAWTRIAETEIVAICDLDSRKAKRMAHQYGIPEIYSELEDLLTRCDFDVLDIITPPATHFTIIQKAMTYDKHIICQKPLAPTYREALEIVEMTSHAGIRFMVHENFRFQPWYRKMKSLMAEDKVGDIIHTISLQMRMGDGWGRDAYLDRQPYFQTMPRFFVYETGIHYIDVFRYLRGEISKVYARLRKLNPVIAGEDCVFILLDFAKGGLGIIDGNRFNEANYENPRYTFGTTTIEGNKGSIRLYPDGRITLQLLGKKEEEVKYVHAKKGFAGDCVYFTQRHFIECLQKNRPFETSGEEYLKNIKVQEAIYESSATGKEVYL